MLNRHFSLMIHGGAGSLEHINSTHESQKYSDSLESVLTHGRRILENGGSALEAVEQCASLMEDDPLYNAGRGSVLNEMGRVEMDAAIMEGTKLKAGAVAGITNIANPVQLARLVLSECEHVMLIGFGALRFADHFNIERTPDHYFITDERIKQWEQAKKDQTVGLDHGGSILREPIINTDNSNKFGTIGAIARDLDGNLAAATSTGGLVNKRFGRVGDSPIIGAGVYADNETCAVSCTGFGEDFIRTAFAKSLSDIILFSQADAQSAITQGIEYFVRKVNGRGGAIIIDKDGNCAKGFTTPKMIHGWIEKSGEPHCGF